MNHARRTIQTGGLVMLLMGLALGLLLPPHAEAQTPAGSAEEADPRSLIPPGEEARMEARPVDPERIRYQPGKGLELRSEDGDFRLQTRIRLQTLYELVNEDGGAPPAHQLTLRRARLAFAGSFFGEDNRFKFELAVSPRDEGIRDNLADRPSQTPLLDFYLEFRQLRDLTLRIGQYKLPFNRQRVVSSGNLQMVDRSLLNARFNIDRDVGFDLRSPDLLGLGLLRYYAGVYINRGRGSVGLDDFGLLYVGRVELLPLGMFSDYSEADFERGAPRLSLGLSYAYADRARRERINTGSMPNDGGTTDVHVLEADALFMWGGLSMMSEIAYRSGTRNEGPALPAGEVADLAANGLGFVAQAGYLLPGMPLEASARYGMIRGVGTETSMDDENELGLGLSYYFARHPFKVQADLFRLWEDEFGAGETRLRVQLQGSL